MATRSNSSGWRRVVANILAVCFILAGLVFGGAGIKFGIAKNSSSDVAAGAVVGGLLVLIGFIIYFAARKAAKRAAETDRGALAGVTMAHMMNMDDGSDVD